MIRPYVFSQSPGWPSARPVLLLLRGQGARSIRDLPRRVRQLPGVGPTIGGAKCSGAEDRRVGGWFLWTAVALAQIQMDEGAILAGRQRDGDIHRGPVEQGDGTRCHGDQYWIGDQSAGGENQG